MPEILVIRLPEDADAAGEWVIVDGAGAPLGDAASGPLSDAQDLAEGRKIIALAPATCVLRTSAEIPLRSAARIRQALPFALEEQLAVDVDEQHFAFGKKMANGRLPVAVAASALVDNWVSTLENAGLRPEALYAESDAVAAIPATITVLADAHCVIIRDPAGAITVADHDSLQTVLDLLLAEADEAAEAAAGVAVETVSMDATPDVDPDAEVTREPLNLLVYVHADVQERHAMLWEMLRLRVESLDLKLLATSALPRLASEVVNTGGVNLLQGRYAPKTEFGIHWQQWRLAATLLLGLAALLLVRTGVDYWQLSRTETALDQAAAQVLASTFSDVGEVSDPWSELRGRLGDTSVSDGMSGGPGFAEAIEVVAAAFSATPDIELEALNYREGTLDVQFLAPNVERLDQLRQRIIEPGEFAAEIQSANPDNDRVKGRMKISAAGGA